LNEEGVIVITNLIEPATNTGFLLINFNTEDITQLIDEKICSCGCPLTKIAYPYRVSDFIPTLGLTKSFFEDLVVDLVEKNTTLTGEWETLVKKNDDGTNSILLRLESRKETEITISNDIKELLEDLKNKKINIELKVVGKGELELFKKPGKPKRI